jgi:hypothetical protein
MTKLLFLSRVALLCNICFVITLLMHYVPVLSQGVITSTVIILGTVMAIVINALMNFLYLIIALSGQRLQNLVPLWIIIINFLFLILQAILLIR